MTKRILVVDDDRNIGQILHASFSAKGYETIISRNGEDALIQFHETKPDLVLLDVLLPKMNGWEVCQKIKESESNAATPVILMSAVYKNFKMQAEAKEKYGADDFIEKPFQLTHLLSMVGEYIGVGNGKDEQSADIEIEPDTAREPEAPREVMSGELTTVTFPELLHSIYVMGKSGTLIMARGDVRKEIAIHQGYPVSVATSIEKEYFGNYLVRMRKITSEQNAESLERQKDSARLQGTILIEMGAITPQELVHFLKLQMREKIFDIFSWREGKFEYIQDSSITGDISAIDMSTANVIFFGVKSHFDLDYSQEKLSSYFNRYLRMGTNQYYRFQELDLSPAENKLLSTIDGTLTVEEIIGNSALPPQQSYHLMLTLIYSGMCDAVSEKGEHPTNFFEAMNSGEDQDAETRYLAANNEVVFSGDAVESADLEEFDVDSELVEPAETFQDGGKSLRKMIEEKFEQMQTANKFEILDLESNNPTEHEVRRNYHRLAKDFHPDKFFGSVSPEVKQKVEAIFQTISQVYESLSTQKKINIYIKELEGQKSADDRHEARVEGVKKIIMAERLFQNGSNFLRERRFTRAADAFQKAVEITNEPEYIAYYGWALYNMPFESDLDEEELALRGNESDADFQFQGREHLNRAIAVNPRTEKAYIFLGHIYKGQGLKEFAERQFEKALICNPNSIEALRELRLIKLEEQKKEKKKGLFQRLLKR